MTTWRRAFGANDMHQSMHMDMPEEDRAPRSQPSYIFDKKRPGPSGTAAFKVGDMVAVTPDEDDDFGDPFVGKVAQEPSYNDIFAQFVYSVRTPDGDELSVFEKQLQRA